VPHAPALRRVQHAHGLVGVATKRPLTVNVLAGIDGRHHRPVMIRHLDADRHQIDIGVCGHLRRVRERQFRAVMSGGRLGGFRPRRADGNNLVLGQCLEGGNVGNRGETSAGAGPDDADPKLVAAGHDPSC